MVRAKDKSMEQLENDKKWDKWVSIGIVVFFIGVCSGVLFLLMNDLYKKGYENGYEDSNNSKWCVKLPEKPQEVSVLEEQKKCEEIGGEFNIDKSYSAKGRVGELVESDLDYYTLICTSPAKELFKYNIK
jgi:hypothetical protein